MTGPPKTEIDMTNFEFNVALDKSLFSVEIPQGYNVADVNVNTPRLMSIRKGSISKKQLQNSNRRPSRLHGGFSLS